jgi:alkylation response protein AidB-like acyl-CoA dehydrogenase
VKLAWSDEEEAFRGELVAFLDANAPPEAKAHFGSVAGEEAGIPQWAREWQATLFDHGWLVPGYPPELGGRNATPVQSLIFMEELARRGIIRSAHFPGYAIVGPSLREFGSEAQQELVRPALRGDTVWCIGMSEPNAGSDLGSLSTRALLDGDHFVVNGQKVWTSYAMWAEKCFCYVRSDPSAPKHRGISVLIIDMDTPGIEVRPLRHLSGKEEFAEVFFTDVVVEVDNLVGAMNDGWKVTMGSLAHERGGLWVQGVAGLERTLSGLVEMAEKTGCAGDQALRRSIADAYARVSSLRSLGYKGFSSFATTSSAPEHSFLKLAASEMGSSLYELGLKHLGGAGVLSGPDVETARWIRAFFTGFANTIAGGTSEIQRNIIAERVLGLPRG